MQIQKLLIDLATMEPIASRKATWIRVSEALKEFEPKDNFSYHWQLKEN